MGDAFEAKFSPEQRDAVAHAYEDRRIRPARRVAQLASLGELTTSDGTILPPFKISIDYIRDLAADLRRRRLGHKTSQLAALPPRDAIEHLRRRLVNAADAELQTLERQKPGTRDLERLRQIGRLIREAQAIPPPTEPRPPAPGARANGQRDGGETRGGLAGQLLNDHRRSSRTETAHDTPLTQDHHGEHNTPDNHAKNTPRTEEDDTPAFAVRELAADLGVDLEED